MKKLYFLFLLLITGTVSYGQDWTNVLLKDDFNYANGSGLIANGWSLHSGSTSPILVGISNGLSYGGYLTNVASGNAAILTSAGEDVNKTFTSQTTGSVYASILVNVTNSSLAGDYFLHFGPNPIGTNFKGKLFVKKDALNKLAFGVSHSSNYDSNPTLPNFTLFNYDLNVTYLIVFKYEFVAGTTNDKASIIINPDINATEPTIGWTSNIDTNTDPSNISSIALRQGTANQNVNVLVDGLRVTNVWPFSISDAALDVEKNEIANFSLYPNPVKGGKVFISSANNYAERSVAIFDVLGKQVVSQKGTQNSVDVSHLNKGVYIIKVAEEGKVATRKLVIE